MGGLLAAVIVGLAAKRSRSQQVPRGSQSLRGEIATDGSSDQSFEMGRSKQDLSTQTASA
jgi:hypothetical protein